jgi:hypothetical protein
VHRLQAFYRFSNNMLVASNVAEVEVKQNAKRHERLSLQIARECLTDRKVSQLLFYRSWQMHRSARIRLGEYVNSHESSVSMASIHYALGSILRKEAQYARSQAHKKHLREVAIKHFRGACRGKGIGGYRYVKAQEFLERPRGE